MAKLRISPQLVTFAQQAPEVEAVLQRIGKGNWDLLLIDVDGNWERSVFASEDRAEAACSKLGVPMHRGWEEEPRMGRRMNRLNAWATPGAKRRAQ